MDLTIQQMIEWHRVRGKLAVAGATVALDKGDVASSTLFMNEAEFHAAAVELLESKQ
jgi:uncharacterized protein YciI